MCVFLLNTTTLCAEYPSAGMHIFDRMHNAWRKLRSTAIKFCIIFRFSNTQLALLLKLQFVIFHCAKMDELVDEKRIAMNKIWIFYVSIYLSLSLLQFLCCSHFGIFHANKPNMWHVHCAAMHIGVSWWLWYVHAHKYHFAPLSLVGSPVSTYTHTHEGCVVNIIIMELEGKGVEVKHVQVKFRFIRMKRIIFHIVTYGLWS